MSASDNPTYAAEWSLGHEEAEGDVGMTYDDDPESPRSRAYDEGRTAGRVALGLEDGR